MEYRVSSVFVDHVGRFAGEIYWPSDSGNIVVRTAACFPTQRSAEEAAGYIAERTWPTGPGVARHTPGPDR